MVQNTISVAGTLSSSLKPGMNNDFRLGFSRDKIALDRPEPQIPILTSLDNTFPAR